MSVWDNEYQNNAYTRKVAKGDGKPAMFFGNNYYFDIDGHNEVIKDWTSKVTTAIKSSAEQMVDGKTKSFVMRGQQKEGKLAKSIRSITKEEFGAIESVTFTFERHGVFVHKGVGRGYPASSPREKVEWFNPVLERYLPELADRLAERNADIVVNAERMKIK